MLKHIIYNNKYDISVLKSLIQKKNKSKITVIQNGISSHIMERKKDSLPNSLKTLT